VLKPVEVNRESLTLTRYLPLWQRNCFFGREVCLLRCDLHNKATSRLMQPGNIPGHWHSIFCAVEYLAHCAVLASAN